MELFNIAALLITLTAVFSYINYRYLKIHMTIGVIIISMVMSIALMIADHFGLHLGLKEVLASIDFNETMLVGMLSFLLFAGALHININDLMDHWLAIGIFATFGVILSTGIVGLSMFAIFRAFNTDMGLMSCLLFGALISPTDPIAVLGILKTANAPKDLEIRIAGESLFNDGVGVVVFIVLLSLAGGGGHEVSLAKVSMLFCVEVFGGALLGFVLGWIGFYFIKQVDEYQVEIMMTLALVTGGYAASLSLHVSGPIAIVIIGIMMGNKGRSLAMSEKTRQHLDTFWELIDELLNAVLFVLIGLEVLVISIRGTYLFFGLLAIPVVLFARWICVAVPVIGLKKWVNSSPGTIRILTWGGLRGGISVALALSLPPGPVREIVLTMTYSVVVFSLIVQGLTVKRLL
jgi:CPA1 family monovalent cation:H+ antiporter